MIKLLKYAFILFLLIIGCHKTEDLNSNTDDTVEIGDGNYLGHFFYRNNYYWCHLRFTNKTYQECPSGGVMHQKPISCLTEGSFSINGQQLSFILDKFRFIGFPETCEPDMLLPGDYKIFNVVDPDSLVFERGMGNYKIVYNLMKLKE